MINSQSLLHISILSVALLQESSFKYKFCISKFDDILKIVFHLAYL